MMGISLKDFKRGEARVQDKKESVRHLGRTKIFL